MATRKQIESKFLEVCESYGFKTSSERGVESYYENSFYLLDFNEHYGYQIQKIDKSTACSDISPRMNAKEIYAYMQGLINARILLANTYPNCQ